MPEDAEDRLRKEGWSELSIKGLSRGIPRDAPGTALRFPQAIDNTMRSDFVLCPHRWFRRHCQGLTPLTQTKSIHLHFGGCFAKGLQVTREHYCAGASPTSAVYSGVAAAITEWGDMDHDPITGSEALKTLPALVDALASYFERYPLDRDALRILDLGHGPLIERSFAVPVPGTRHPDTNEPVLYAGRCDMVCTARDAEGVWIVDEKTASRLGANWTEKWDLDSQPTGYTWGFQSYGLKPIGAIMRGIGIMSRDITFAESIQPRPQWKVESWLRQLVDDITAMTAMYTSYRCMREWPYLDPEGRAFPRALDDHACGAYNKPCQYKPLCNSASPSRWLDDYVVDYWEPLTLAPPASSEATS